MERGGWASETPGTFLENFMRKCEEGDRADQGPYA